MTISLNPKQWEPVVMPLRGTEANRTPALLNEIIDQFNVTSQLRYVPDIDPVSNKHRTWCNIFVWDVTTALGCEIPHWIPNPEALTKPGAPKRLETQADDKWLKGDGSAKGWQKVVELAARANAEMGRPGVAVGGGHIVVLRPRKSGDPIGTYCAQAGKSVFGYGPLVHGFGLTIHPDFYIHA